MIRRSLSAFTFLLIPAVVVAGEPRRESRPIEARGRVVVGPLDVAPAGYDLAVVEGGRRRYPLVPMSDAHVRLLRRVAERPREVEVVGILSSVDSQSYIIVEYIGEYP